MADFYKIVAPTLKFEGGYSNRADDAGNYCIVWSNGKPIRGALVGTNKGIAASTLQTYLGRCPSVAEMKALSTATATNIYKTIFWDGLINGTAIKDQYVAFMCFQAVIGAISNIKILRKSINKVSTIKKVVEDTTPFGKYTVEVINSLPAKKLFDTMWADYLAHLRAVDARVYKGTVPGWYVRMDAIKKWAGDAYASSTNTIKANPVSSIGIGIGVALVAYMGYNSVKNNSKINAA